MSDAWNVKPPADGKLPTLLTNSTFDHATVEAIASGQKPFPNYSDIPLTPQRRLLHEVIIQAVTDRRLTGAASTEPREERLARVVHHVERLPAYQQMAAHGEVDAVKVSVLLDAVGLAHLPNVPAHDRTTVMMATGGPATGKDTLMKGLAANHPGIYRNAAIVNADDYKPLLADPHHYGEAYANAAHAESAYLSDAILDRLSRKMDMGRAPNVVLDVVTLSEQRMAFAKKSSHLIVATGTAPSEVSLERSRVRGEATGRVVPSEAVLAGAKAVSATTPRVFEHPHAQIELFDTNVPFKSEHVLIAQGNSHMLVIREPDAFLNFIEQQHIDAHAKGPAQLLLQQAQTPSSLATGLKAYTDKGVTLAFLDPHGNVAISVSPEGVDQIRHLSSARGASFFPELVAASKVALDVSRHASVPEGHAAHEAEKPHLVNESAYHAHGNAVGAGVGVALSGKGIYDDVAGHDSRLTHDSRAGGVQAAAGQARFGTEVADFTISAAATVEGAYRALGRAAPVAVTAMAKAAEGPAMRLAGRVAIPLAVGAGALEATAGIAEHNTKRVAAAVGSTSGGIFGGIAFGALAGAAWGAVGGSETGPGAIATAGIGALGGAVVGGIVGEEKAKEYLTGAIDKAMHLFDHHATKTSEATPQPTRPGMSPDMLRALSAAKHAGLAHGIHVDAHSEHSAHPAAPTIQAGQSKAVQHR
jgi:hypothetical protein